MDMFTDVQIDSLSVSTSFVVDGVVALPTGWRQLKESVDSLFFLKFHDEAFGEHRGR